MKTKLLYLKDSYLSTCTAKVVSVTAKGKQQSIVLDQTIMYPIGGGQPADHGQITSTTGAMQVKDVRLVGTEVHHIGRVTGAITAPQTVQVAVNWDRRYQHMQHHTAGHLLDEAVKDSTPEYMGISGKHGVGGQFFITFSGIIDSTQKLRIQAKVAEIIANQEPITTKLVTKAQIQAAGIHLPFKLPDNKPLRLITIGSRQPVPDGGTQLKNTGEAWPIVLGEFEYGDGHTTIHYRVEQPQQTTGLAKTKPDQPRAQKSSKPKKGQSFSPEKNQTMSQFKAQVADILKQAESATLSQASRTQFLGKQGHINQLTKRIPQLPVGDRAQAGKLLNQTKAKLEQVFTTRHTTPATPQQWLDVTAPGENPPLGHLHPISKIFHQVEDITSRLGFSLASGPEIEWDEINFQKLRLGPDHPSRDTQETYYFDDKKLLRVHTSSVQIRYMQTHPPPIRIISPGRVYRRDTIDATHLPSFHQIEGLLVDEHTTLTDLLGMLEYIARQLFGPDRKVRFYGHNFPYTEPSLEVEVQDGRGKWLEILGCGMVHPEVLENCGLDSQTYQGWAFGMGADRLAMLKYNISDIRDLYGGDLRFLAQ